MRRNSWILVILVVAVVAAALTIFEFGTARHAGTDMAPHVTKSSPANPGPPQAQEAIAPSFDAVRVGPDGTTVIAGRAAPGAEVTILNRGEPIGHVTADQNGEFVFMPDKPLAPGPQELSLSSRAPGETTATPSTKSLAVLVPERGPGGEAPVAVLLPQNADEAARTVQLETKAGQRVTLDMVEYDASGRIVFSGRAAARTQIELFVNDRRVAAATADDSGSWSAETFSGVPVGRYRLRLDVHGAGQLVVDLRRAAPGELGTGNYLAVVPGNTLWHLAVRSFGEGMRYVEIYRANRDKIDDPDRIYPGELLALPAKP